MRGKRYLIITVCLSCLVLAQGTAMENPYQPIVDRNVFNLRPPPPKPTEAELEAKQPPPNVFLTGIHTLFNNKRAFLKTTPTAGPAKPGAEKPTEESYILAEGQRDGDVEVVEIDEKKGMVKIRLAGKEMTLDFDNNGVKTATSPTPGRPGMPGALPGMPPTGLPRPIMPSTSPTPISTSLSNPGSTPSMPSRTLRLPGAPGTTGASVSSQPGISLGGIALGGPASSASPPSVNAGGRLTTINGQEIPDRSRDEAMAIAAVSAMRREELIKKGANIPLIKPPWMRELDGQPPTSQQPSFPKFSGRP